MVRQGSPAGAQVQMNPRIRPISWYHGYLGSSRTVLENKEQDEIMYGVLRAPPGLRAVDPFDMSFSSSLSRSEPGL